MLDSYGPVIQDALLVRDLNQARRTANSMFSDPRIEWVEIVEVQWPGPDGDFDYVDCGHREKLQRPDS